MNRTHVKLIDAVESGRAEESCSMTLDQTAEIQKR